MTPRRGVKPDNFRDPSTACRGKDGHWRVVVGGLNSNLRVAILYRSKDFVHWSLHDEPLNFGKNTNIWECPDFYPMSINSRDGIENSTIRINLKYVLKANFKSHDYYTIGSYDADKEKFLPDDKALLSFLADMHSLGLIHIGLKSENILLVSSDYLKLPIYKRTSQGETHFKCLPKSSEIKLIDFGSIAYHNKKHSSIVSTRHYRAPEGEALFQTHERVLGALPEHMVQRANQGAEKYFRRSKLKWPEGVVSRESIRAVRKLDHLKNMISGCVSYGGLRSCIVDLLYGLLKFDPEERLTVEEALDHPFFRNTSD
ncbi:unnamed protein product [Lactuca virosa]|uniref:Protein kinase domain-containing protein n=1 Tax=Lactuca virosa TaxID=75947 RepID=A0AAU9ND88_9ASTR|nr:unnamed protein product [Lactuca virosa]